MNLLQILNPKCWRQVWQLVNFEKWQIVGTSGIAIEWRYTEGISEMLQNAGFIKGEDFEIV